MKRLTWVALAIAILIVSACASAPTIPPGGVGDDGEEGVARAYGEGVLRRCVALTFTARMQARGSVDGRPLNRSVSLTGDRVSGSIRLESIDSKQPPFTFVVSDVFRSQVDPGWTLFSLEGNWVVRGKDSREAIETIIRLPLSAEEFLWTMTGCSPNLSGHFFTGQRFGSTSMKISFDDKRPLDIELHRKDAASPWSLSAMSRAIPGRMTMWRMELEERVGGVHRRIRVVSRPSTTDHSEAFDLRLSLSDIQVNPRLSPETFSATVPASARVVSLETLRHDAFK